MQISRRSFVTVSTTVGLTGLYGLYAYLVNPLLAPAPIDAEGAAGGPPRILPPRESREIADRWLSSQPWAARAAYQLRTDEAFVYFEEWEPTDSDEAVRLRPFAVVWTPEGRDSNEEPIRIICDSAYLRFASKFSITDSNPGRVIGGSLEGDVRIQGKDGLDVVGRNFVFSEAAMRVWSDDRVKFAHGPHRGQALGLQMELIPDETADRRDSVAVSGIRSVRLRRNVAMDLLIEEQMPNADRKPALSRSNRTSATPVNIRSAGSFTFVTETNVATFEEEVRVRKPTAAGELDTLDCEKLTLTFEPEETPAEDVPDAGDDPSSSTVAKTKSQQPAGNADRTSGQADSPRPAETGSTGSGRAGEGDRFKGIAGNLTFRKLQAEGKQVVLTSQANDMRAHMNRLEYDSQNGVGVLSDETLVRVTQEASELKAPEITLIHDQAGEVHSAWCRGAGSLSYFDSQSGETQLHARWDKQLRKYPDPDSKLDIIELEQRAVMRQPLEHTGLAADFIKLWIDPEATTDPIALGEGGTSGGEPRSSASEEFRKSPESLLSPAGPGGDVRIDRLLAVKNVAMVSPQMHAETARLEVWFEDADLAPSKVKQESNTRSLGRNDPVRSADARFDPSATPETEGKNSRITFSDNAERTAESPAADRPAQKTTPRPDRESARDPSITVTVPRANSKQSARGRRSRAQDLVSPVSESEQARPPVVERRAIDPVAARKAEEPAEPAVVVADLIQAKILQDRRRGASRVSEIRTYGNVEVTQQRAAGEQPLRITGDRLNLESRSERDQLVHVYGEPAHIRDPQVQVEGRVVHMDRGANLTWVEGEGVLGLPVKNSLEGEPLETPETLHIWWKEKMTFDGETAHFFGDVHSFLKASRMRCQEMEVVLTQRISFDRDPRASADSGDFRESPQSLRDSPESKVRQVICRGGVDVESREYLNGDVVELRRARFWELTLNQITGRTVGTGPGWISLWRRGDGQRAGLSPVALVRANRPLGSQAVEWEYSRIDFSGKADGNIKQNFTTFSDRVEIVHGPIKKPLDTIDPDNLPENGGWMRSETLTLTRHEETATQPAYVNMLGDGNVELEGRMPVRDGAAAHGENFRARADTISFDESKGLYTLRSGGNRTATIWRQKRRGGPYSRHDAQRMEFLPALNQLKSNHAIGTIGIE